VTVSVCVHLRGCVCVSMCVYAPQSELPLSPPPPPPPPPMMRISCEYNFKRRVA
jgi:hypothetical protein